MSQFKTALLNDEDLRQYAVYAIWEADGTLAYIGMSDGPERRFAYHRWRKSSRKRQNEGSGPVPKQIKTYSVQVRGFDAALYSAKTPGGARAAAHRHYQSYRDCTFKEFMSISTVKRAPDPDGAGEKIYVCGKPAIRVLDDAGRVDRRYPRFVYEDSDVFMRAHKSEVTPRY